MRWHSREGSALAVKGPCQRNTNEVCIGALGGTYLSGIA